MVLSVDPGVHSMAVAVWMNDKLVEAWNEQRESGDIIEKWASPSVRLVNKVQAHRLVNRVQAHMERARCYRVPALFGERQVFYPGAKGLRTDPNDLLDLALATGSFYAGLSCELRLTVHLIKPAEWKAQVPKDITKKRILSLLDDAEINAIVKGGEMHNVFDAIGIGLFGLGRAKRGMVKP